MKEGNFFSLTDQEVILIISVLEKGFRWHGLVPLWVEHKLLSKPKDSFLYIYIYIYIFKDLLIDWLIDCYVGSSFLCEGFLQLRRAGATLHRGARASSLSRPLLLRSTGSRCAGSVVVAHGPSRSAACGIFPDQGSNPCPLHQQADSQPLRHQGSPSLYIWFWLVLIHLIL